nr:hypothetical protein [Tanacetum cinerariifolium]
MHRYIAWDKVDNPNQQNISPSKINEPYEPSSRMDSYGQPLCLGSTFVSEALSKSDQMHQTFEKSYLAMTHKLDDMIKLPESQPKKTYKGDLKCKMVMVKIPKCMSWLDAYNEPIGDLNMMEDMMDNPSLQSTPQFLPSFKVYTPPVTYPEEVDETIGILMEVEPLNQTQEEDLGLNTCNHNLSFSFREVLKVN